MKIDLVATGYIISNNKVLLIHHKKLNLWLPVGGHMEEGETPDGALGREVKEETNLDIEILGQSDIPTKGNVKENLATPFYVNIHSVGGHDHCSLFYVCKALNPKELKINNELKNYDWFSVKDLNNEKIQIDVRNQAVKALEIFRKHNR